MIRWFFCRRSHLCYLHISVSRRFHRFSRNIPFKTLSRYEQETSSRHWIPGQYERPPHQPQLNSTVSQLCSLRTRGAPSATGVKSLHIIGRVHSSQGGSHAAVKKVVFPPYFLHYERNFICNFYNRKRENNKCVLRSNVTLN